MSTTRYIVRIGTDEAAEYVVKYRSGADLSRMFVVSVTTKDPAKARYFARESEAIVIAKKNRGTVVTVGDNALGE